MKGVLQNPLNFLPAAIHTQKKLCTKKNNVYTKPPAKLIIKKDYQQRGCLLTKQLNALKKR